METSIGSRPRARQTHPGEHRFVVAERRLRSAVLVTDDPGSLGKRQAGLPAVRARRNVAWDGRGGRRARRDVEESPLSGMLRQRALRGSTTAQTIRVHRMVVSRRTLKAFAAGDGWRFD